MAKISLQDFQELQTIDRLYSFSSLLDVLLNVEGFFDDLHIYAYDKNWYKGEVVSGPTITRYWVTLILKFDEKCMPNPEVIKVLNKTGCRVHYEQGEVEVHEMTSELTNVNSKNYMSVAQKRKVNKVWYVEISIPKKLIYNNIDLDVEKYQEDVDFDVFDAENIDEDGME